ncbi:hypothetical protein WGM54_17995 [Paenibacillus polymyxa]
MDKQKVIAAYRQGFISIHDAPKFQTWIRKLLHQLQKAHKK